MLKLSKELSEKHLSHLDFSSRFKFIRHEKNPQLFSFLLMRDTETKRTVLAKNYIYQGKSELQTILQDYQQLLKIYGSWYTPNTNNSASKSSKNHNYNPYFCDFLGFCLQRQNNQDLIYLLYDYHHCTLQEQINSKKLHNNRQQTKKGFTEQQINCFIQSCLRGLCQLETYGMNFMCWSFKYVLVQNLGNIDMKFRLLFTPFLTDAVEQIQKQKPQVQQYFLSEHQLTQLSKPSTPAYTTKLKSDKQSLGMMSLKLATILNQQDRFYEMNDKFQLVWNSEGLKRRLEYLSKNYSGELVRKIEYLIFQGEEFYGFRDCWLMREEFLVTFSGNKGNLERSRLMEKGSARNKRSRISNASNNLQKSGISSQKQQHNNHHTKQNKNSLFSTIKKHQIDFSSDNNTPQISNIHHESPTKIKKNNYQTKLQFLQATFSNKIPKDTIHQLEDPKIGETYIGQIKNGRKKGLGINYNREGDVYFGEWSNDQMTGEGTYLFKNSDVYTGQIYQGLKHGQGRYEHWNGNVYEGEWANDLKNGYGRYEYVHKGDIYQGYFKNNLRDGQGQYKWKNGSRYLGMFSKGYKQGIGTAYLSNGVIIDGKWSKDTLQGNTNQIRYPSGKIYKGSLSPNLQYGQGSQHDQFGFRCKGTYTNGKRKGYFQIEYQNGDHYKGDFSDSKPHGRGTYYYAHNEATYRGQWKNGKQNGKGVIKFKNGTQIECNWCDGEYEKIGTIRYSNGDEYCGEIDGLGRNGRGVYVTSQGISYKGLFKNGVLISSQ